VQRGAKICPTGGVSAFPPPIAVLRTDTELRNTELRNNDRRDTVVPGVTTAKGNGTQVRDADTESGAAVAEVAIIKDGDPGSAKDLDRGDIVAEVRRQGAKTVSGTDAEVISGEVAAGVDAGPTPWIGTPIPGRIPGIVLRTVDPGVILGRRARRVILGDGSDCEQKNESCCNSFHELPPGDIR
jgi:hypothetical protein